MTRTAAALERDRDLANARQRRYYARKVRRRVREVAEAAPYRDDTCRDCGRAHRLGPDCPEPPREYHDVPFLKKYGA